MTAEERRALAEKTLLRTPDLEWAHDLVHGLAHAVLAADDALDRLQARLEAAEAERDGYQEQVAWIAGKLAETQIERDAALAADGKVTEEEGA